MGKVDIGKRAAGVSPPGHSGPAGKSDESVTSRPRNDFSTDFSNIVMLNLFQHPATNRLAGGDLDPETSSG
jgi:hypothetical protein